MKLGYVAGPFRGRSHWDIHENIRNAERLALEVWRLGCACICPHTNTIHFQDAAQDDVWLNGDLEMLKRCDFVVMTPDWRRSSGATAEHRFAEGLGLPIFYTIDELKTWLANQAPFLPGPVVDIGGVVMTDP